ncbi:hypothetical protein O9992_28140 [Vibrio lentus]|nr:hypothetical protein [Vibrio lentus]
MRFLERVISRCQCCRLLPRKSIYLQYFNQTTQVFTAVSQPLAYYKMQVVWILGTTTLLRKKQLHRIPVYGQSVVVDLFSEGLCESG